MWEGCAAGFVIEDALRGNDRKPTDIICFLSTVSSILLLSLDIGKKNKRKLFLAPENILREKQKNNFRLFFPWPVNFGLVRDHMSISAHNVMRSI